MCVCPPAIELLLAIGSDLPKILGAGILGLPNRDCKSLIIYSFDGYSCVADNFQKEAGSEQP